MMLLHYMRAYAMINSRPTALSPDPTHCQAGDAATLHARLCHDQLTTKRPLSPPHPLPGRRATSGDHCNPSQSSSSKLKPVRQIEFEQIQANSTSGSNLKQLQRKKANGDNPSSSSEVHFKFQRLTQRKPPTPPKNHPSAHAGSRARATSMGGLYDAATLHARLCHDQLTTNRPLTPPHPLPGRRATIGDHCNAS